MNYSAVDLIQKKKLNKELTADEIQWLISSYAEDKIPDYQMAAWAMAIYFNGMSTDEVAAFTLAMKNSGEVFDFSHLNAPRVDKHSTGGVGDKTSIVIGPILAAAQIYTPMIAGRGLAHTGGTLDKLESIPGFSISLDKQTLTKNVEKHFFSLMGQTKEICPSDRKLYALRDVTSTVDSLPLICGSIMSKKLAEDLTGLVLDVKYGSGAFMKTLEQSEALAKLLKFAGDKNGVKVHALITSMDQPLGRYAGNALEIKECVDILKGEKDAHPDTYKLSIELSAHAILLAEKANNLDEARSHAEKMISTGKAYEAFEKWLEYQGPSQIEKLPEAKFTKEVLAPRAGFIASIDTEKAGWSTVALKVGRLKTTDSVDPAAGIEFYKKQTEQVEAGEPIAKLYASDEKLFEKAEQLLLESYSIKKTAAENPLPLIAKVLT